MNKAFEKILEQLEELQNYACFPTEWVNEEQSKIHSYYANKLTEILKLTEQYSNGWIPCSDDSSKLPKENENVRVTVWTGIERIGFRQYGKWYTYTSEGIGEATVVAWQPTEPFKERD